MKPNCVVCSHSRSTLEVDGVCFCAACAAAIGRLARAPLRGLLWPALPAPRSRPRGEGWAAGMVAQLTEALDANAGVADAQVHLDLAIAYREMKLPDDALTAAASALQHAQTLSVKRAELALSMVLAPDVLSCSIDEALRLLRSRILS